MMDNKTHPAQPWTALAAVGLTLACGAAPADDGADATPPGAIEIRGRLPEADDISAVTTVGPLLVLGSDEGTAIVVLEPADGPRSYRRLGAPLQLLSSPTEIDIEGLAASGRTVYALGSHSLKRTRIKPGAAHDENRRRVARVLAERSRDHLFRFELDPRTGRPAAPVESVDLRRILAGDEILSPFTRVPGKENGVDIEGLAVDGTSLYLGFRSPVLRDGWVPVMVLAFDEPQGYELRFVDLGGRGIRAMCRVDDGFLIVGGPPGPGEGSYGLWLWNGEDCLPGAGGRGGRLTRLADLPADGGRPEGIALLAETPSHYDLLLVHDGVTNGAPRSQRFPKP